MLIIEDKYQIVKYKDNMTEAEFYEFCAANENMQIERDKDRNIIIMPLSDGTTGYYENEISCAVGRWEDQYGGISFSPSVGFELKNTAIRSPDASWVNAENWATLTDEDKKKFVPVPPDFIAEISAPIHHLEILKAKMREWIDNGVRLAWLIDPKTKKTHIYRET